VSLASLDPEVREVIRRAMEGTFSYFDLDFHTRLGVNPQGMRALLGAWPNLDDSSDESDACLAINNSLNDLLHGEGISEQEAMAVAGVSRDEMARIFRKWRAARGWESTF
jgi:hypothetical protein